MAAFTGQLTNFTRSDLSVETKEYPIPFTSCKTWNSMAVNLPASPSSDDLGLVHTNSGGVLNSALTLQATDPGGATVTQLFGFEYALPPEYVTGAAISIRVKGKCTTGPCDTSCTVDFNVYRDNEDGTIGSDLMASPAFSINSTSVQEALMTITPGTLSPGDKLIVVGTVAATDVGNATAIVPTILKLKMVLEIKG